MLSEFNVLEMTSQLDDSETTSSMFKRPRTSLSRREVPSGTIESEKLNYVEESHIPVYNKLNLEIEGISDIHQQDARPLMVLLLLILMQWLHPFQKLLHVKSAR